MIYVYTGTPGAGKTMSLVADAVSRGEAEGRPVYVSGIPGLAGPGIVELADPADWMSCPDNSIIVVDEAQRVWGMRLAKEAIPPSIRAMEVHRHRGIDIYCATQSINMLDVHLRRLCGVHRHLVRVFGLRASTVYEWDEACDDTRDKAARKTSRKSRFKFSRKYFSRYKSMTLDTAQRRLPWWLKIGVPVLVVFLVGAMWGMHEWFAGMRRHFGAHAVAHVAMGSGPRLPPGYHFVAHSVPVRRAVTHRHRRGGAHGWRVRGVIRGRGLVVWLLTRRGSVVSDVGSACKGARLVDVRCPAPGGGWAHAF